jgi:hypothetical protein
MSTVQEIERAAEQLPPEDFAKLAAWVRQRQSEVWDRRIEADIQAGRLDKRAEEAVSEFRRGETRPFPE